MPKFHFTSPAFRHISSGASTASRAWILSRVGNCVLKGSIAAAVACAALLSCSHASEQSEVITPSAARLCLRGGPGFHENAGQMRDQHGNPRNDVLFSYATEEFRLHLRRDGFSFELAVPENSKLEIPENLGAPVREHSRLVAPASSAPEAGIRISRGEVTFIGASAEAEVIGFFPFPDTDNYYLNGMPEAGITGVRRFRRVIMRGIWPGVDAVFAIEDADASAPPALKYSFIVNPGALLSNVRLRYGGAAVPFLRAPDLLESGMPGGLITETLSHCYAISASDAREDASGLIPEEGGVPEGARELNASFRLDGNVLGYSVESARSGEVLVIDPTLQWATFYGGSLQDYATSVATDANGNVYACGWTHSDLMIATSGSHQNMLIGISDAFLVRFSPAGTRTWGTYAGGVANDFAQTVSAAAMNTVVIAGYTASTNGLTGAGAHQQVYGGGLYDGFVMKFSAAGVRQWSTYLGGSGTDQCYGVSVNSSGDIVVAGRTESVAGIATVGAHQSAYGGGNDDAFLAKFNSSGAMIWATYFGGADSEGAASAVIDAGGDAVIAGTTSSPAGIASIGAHSTSLSGALDAFVARFSAAGVRQWATYYGGSGSETGRSAAVDGNGFVILAGGTSSLSGIATPGAHQQSYQFNNDAFVARFSPFGTRQWGSYFGGAYGDEAFAVSVDAGGDIFVAGLTGSGSGIATAGAHQTSQNSVEDAFIAKFSSMGGRLWGSYYGGADNDVAYAVTTDQAGNAIIAGLSSSLSYISTAGSHQAAYGGGISDGFVAKFNGVQGANEIIILSVSKDTLCAGESFQIAYAASGAYGPGNIFTAQLSTPLGYFTPPAGIGQTAAASSGVINAVIPPGAVDGDKYRVRVISSSPPVTGRDNGKDIIVMSLPDTSVSITGKAPFCDGDSVGLCAVFRPSYMYQWKRNGIDIPGAQASCFAVKEDGGYSVRITNSGRCPVETTPVQINLLPSPAVTVTPADTLRLCEGKVAFLTAAASPGAQLAWLKDDVEIPGASGATLAVVLPGRYRARAVNAAGCASLSGYVTVILLPRPEASVVPAGPLLLCRPDSALLRATLLPKARYQWMLDGVDIPGAVGPECVARQAGEYRVVVTNEFNCETLSPPVAVLLDSVPVPVITPSGPLALCQGDSVELTAGPSGGWKIRWFRNGMLMSGAETQSLNIRDEGLYTVEYKTSSGCASTSLPLEVRLRPSPIVRISAQSSAACEGDSIVLYASTDTSNAVAWLRNGALLDGEKSDTLVVRSSGRYSCVAIDTAGCSAHSASLDLVFETTPSAELRLAGPQPACEGDTLLLSAAFDASFRYRWFRNYELLKADTASDLLVVKSGTYRVFVSSSGGCSDSSIHMPVRFIPKPLLRVSGPGSACVQSVRTYAAISSPGAEVTWSVMGGDLVSPPVGETVRVKWSQPGVGILHAKAADSSGACGVDTSIRVAVASRLNPRIRPAGGLTLCDGDSAVLEADPGYASYRWNTGAGGSSLIVRTAGIYFVEVTDGDGCDGVSDTIAVRVSASPFPVIVPSGPLQLCGNDSIVLNAGVFKKYLWSTGDTGASTVLKSGYGELSITVEVENSDGCKGISAPVLVRRSPRPSPRITLSGRTEFCRGDSLLLHAPDGFTAYLWSNGETGRRLVVRDAGSYFLAVADSAGCAGNSDTIAVRVYSVPDAGISGPLSVCMGSEAVFAVPEFDGALFEWISRKGTIVSGAGTNIIRIIWSEILRDTVSVRVVGPGGCSADGILAVDVSDVLRVALSPSGSVTLCEGDTLRLSAPEGLASYGWSTGDSSEGIHVTQAGLYWAHVRDSAGCEGISDTVAVMLAPVPRPLVTLQTAMPACEGDTVIADAGDGFIAYEWSTGETTRRIRLLSASSVWVRVTDANGCGGISPPVSVEFLPKTKPSIYASGATEFCEGDSVTLETGPGAYLAYRWSSGDTTRSVTVKRSGIFHVETDSASACAGISDAIDVIVRERPPIPRIIRAGALLIAPPAHHWRWYRNDTLLADAVGQSVEGADGAVFEVEAFNEFGCMSRSEPFIFRSDEIAATVSLPVIEAMPGERVRIPLLLSASPAYIREGDGYEAKIRLRKDLFHPLLEHFEDAGGLRTITLRGTDNRASDTLAWFEGTATLGAAGESPLEFVSFAWSDTIVTVSLIHGIFRVRVCEEGGRRLFDAGTGGLLLQNRPNPFNAATTVEFRLIESGFTDLSVIDLLGRRVASLACGEMRAGNYSLVFDAGGLSSGVYVLLLTTPSVRLHRRMDLLK